MMGNIKKWRDRNTFERAEFWNKCFLVSASAFVVFMFLGWLL